MKGHRGPDGIASLGSVPTALPPPERFDWTQLPARPWKNGAGLTREIATSPRGATLDDFDWRVSVAEVSADGLFSAYPGVDRTIALLRGAGMRLRGEDDRVRHRLDTVAAPFHFAGEAAIEALLLDGPCSDFNVMTRRSRCHAEVQSLNKDSALSPADALLLLCVQGVWTVSARPGEQLEPAKGLLWRGPVAGIRLSPMREDGAGSEATSRPPARLISVRLCQHPSP